MKLEDVNNPHFKHGHRKGGKSREYMSWQAMVCRCTNHNREYFKHYGGRGITVCDRWLNSFVDFLADMGPRPEGMTLDRINVDGNYEPGNCRWATAKEQTNNKRQLNQNVSKTECLRGHALAPENCEPYWLVRGSRKCLQCKRLRYRKMYVKQSIQAVPSNAPQVSEPTVMQVASQGKENHASS